MSDVKSLDVVLELKKSFLEDKKEIQDKIVDLETQIRQANEYISSLNKKEECDYNIFSPRSGSRVYKDQVYDKKILIEQLEEEVRVLYKKLSGVTKKIDSLEGLDVDELDKVLDAAPSDDSVSNSVFLTMQEEDRQRIAADLHDTVLQNLALVCHNLELAEKFIDYDVIRAKLELETNRKLVKETIEEIRSTIFDLRPMQINDFGFKRAMLNLLDTYKSRTTMTIDSSIDDLDDLDEVVSISIFRIVQELVINSIKHSKGSLIVVNIKDENPNIHIKVSDDGVGFDEGSLQKSNHFGLKILKERVKSLNGDVLLLSEGKGSCVEIIFPKRLGTNGVM